MDEIRRRKLKPWHGILFFLLIMAVFFTVCAYLQMHFGMYGLAATELIIFAMALAFATVMRVPMREIFPVRKPSLARIFGTLLLWVSAYITSMAAVGIIAYFFPAQVLGTNAALNSFIVSVPLAISFVIAAIMPAICEEAVHRGVILHCMLPLERKWLIVFVMGVIFGLFHADIWRFLPTAILGAMLSYIMIETENMVYPALFHCVNNAVPLLLMAALPDMTKTEQITAAGQMRMPLVTVAVYIILSAAVPYGIYFGSYLLKRKDRRREVFPKETRVRTVTVLTVLTVGLFMIGVVLFMAGILMDQELFRMIIRSMR